MEMPGISFQIMPCLLFGSQSPPHPPKTQPVHAPAPVQMQGGAAAHARDQILPVSHQNWPQTKRFTQCSLRKEEEMSVNLAGNLKARFCPLFATGAAGFSPWK